MNSVAIAGGLFGPPQTLSREAGGLNTAIGYDYHEDLYENLGDHVIRQQQIYSQTAYGSKNKWEVYGRIGVSEMKIIDAFRSTHPFILSSKDDFDESWKIFGTLGAKGFFALSKFFGVGAFIQGTYHFSYYTDNVVESRGGGPAVADLKIKNLWDVHLGLALQATAPRNIRLYAGPYVYYSEARTSLDANIAGVPGAGDAVIRNKVLAGGFAGVDIPLIKGFHLNVEGRYARRFSGGAAIVYTY